MRVETANLLVILGLSLAAGCARPLPADPGPQLARVDEIRERILSGSEGAEDGPAASSGTGWANIQGVFRLAGNADVPAPAKLDITKDVAACTANPAATLSERLVIDSGTGGIANVVVYARRVSRVHESKQSPAQPEVEFDQKSCQFLTHVLGIQIGQTIRLLNSDPVGHNTKVTSPISANETNVTIPVGESQTFRPQRPETRPMAVNCSIHPWMSAWILPRDDGYFAVTGPDGTFEITGLPAGEKIEFQVWHESAAGSGLAVARNDLGWKKNGQFSVTLTENETFALEVEVPLSAFEIAGI